MSESSKTATLASVSAASEWGPSRANAVRQAWPTVLKRCLDTVASVVLLVLCTPLMLVVAALIKLTSRGPVFFCQRRLGRNRLCFSMYKFRTMMVGAEDRIREIEHLNEASGPVFKIKRDPRVTPLGRILRKTSIDELPQLINVLKGDMSLVGPRPLARRDYERFDDDSYLQRFEVLPGMTCLWQVSGRSLVPFDEWMELDLQYVEGWSIGLDFRILARTIPAVVKGIGAT